MSGMDRSESVVLDALRKLCPERDWMYLGEVERREISKMVGSLTETYRSSCDQLKVENAKLRELVTDMYRCSDPCNDCPHYNGSNSGYYCGLGIGWKARRMRELGIEADA